MKKKDDYLVFFDEEGIWIGEKGVVKSCVHIGAFGYFIAILANGAIFMIGLRKGWVRRNSS